MLKEFRKEAFEILFFAVREFDQLSSRLTLRYFWVVKLSRNLLNTIKIIVCRNFLSGFMFSADVKAFIYLPLTFPCVNGIYCSQGLTQSSDLAFGLLVTSHVEL